MNSSAEANEITMALLAKLHIPELLGVHNKPVIFYFSEFHFPFFPSLWWCVLEITIELMWKNVSKYLAIESSHVAMSLNSSFTSQSRQGR